MQLKQIEIQNFRKLKSVRIELAEETTLFVGANNSGKTSAMLALRYFMVEPGSFLINDFTLSKLPKIDKIGENWEKNATAQSPQPPILTEWDEILPALDVWLKVEKNEVQHVCDILPNLGWNDNELIGIRIRLEPKKIEDLYKEYITARKTANETIEGANKGEKKCSVSLWPKSLSDFLEKRLGSQFAIRHYLLNPEKINDPVEGIAKPQPLQEGSDFLEKNPFDNLIQIDEIPAHRGFTDSSSTTPKTDSGSRERVIKGSLSGQLRSYYDKHINHSDELVEPSDIPALAAIQQAQDVFDVRLMEGFSEALKELEDLGYPGVTDPRLRISTRIRPIDGLNHDSALQYEVASCKDKASTSEYHRLPEHYNGLGYQNLISIVFKLMGFRDSWMKVGKDGKKAAAKGNEKVLFPPLHLVLIEEPEVHLHAQVQQVFIRKAYNILRKHPNLGKNNKFTTQLIVSTHSSHVAHECKFEWLRYFRRLPAIKEGEVPISKVINLSKVFGSDEDETQKFATRYLKTTHCDLFFADAAILVEGPAERMLVPHFIREHFTKLNQSYITLLEIGGNHAHRLKPLVECIGLTTLVITDLDSAESTGRHPAKQPERQKGLITRNTTLKEWLPAKEKIDELLDVLPKAKIKQYPDFFAVRVAYQCPITIELGNPPSQGEALSNTFEDALVFENLSIFKTLEGDGMIKKFKKAVNDNTTAVSLGGAFFEILYDGKKAEFALDLLYSQEPASLKIPTYINEGLAWLQEQLDKRHLDILIQDKPVDSTPKGADA